MVLIGIIGNIGSGKTTASNYLISKNFTEYSISSPLKKIAEIFNFSKDQLYGTQQQKLEINKYWGISGREFLQKFGTDVCRNSLPSHIPQMKNIWIQLLENYLQLKNIGDCVIPDIRFENEALVILKYGGILIRIDRNTNKKGKEHSHESEKEITQIKHSYRIDNNGSLEELYLKLDQLKNKYLIYI
jgi:adenylate kinase family enzyme